MSQFFQISLPPPLKFLNFWLRQWLLGYYAIYFAKNHTSTEYCIMVFLNK